MDKTTGTCIVGLVKDGVVYMGSDSAAVGGYSIHATTFAKTFIIGSDKNRMLIGYTTSFRMGQVLQYEVSPPEYPEGMEVMKYLVTKFIPAIISTFESKWKNRSAGEEFRGGTFLLGFRGRLFIVFSDFQVNESLNGYLACGCGEDYALGALFATDSKEPEERIRIALESASKFSAGVCAPFNIVKLESQ